MMIMITGKMVEKPYTPVLQDLTDSNGAGWANGESLFFIIKIYPKGVFTQAISALKEGIRIAGFLASFIFII